MPGPIGDFPGHSVLSRLELAYVLLLETNYTLNGSDIPTTRDQITVLNYPLATAPVRARGVKSRMCPPYPQRDRKRRLIGAVCRNHRIKRVVPCRCLDGHVKEPYEMSMAWEPDRRSNCFFSPPAHLCAVTYMTEISLIVTLSN